MRISKSSSGSGVRNVSNTKMAQANQRIGANYGNAVEAIPAISAIALDQVKISPRGRAMSMLSAIMEEREELQRQQKDIMQNFDEDGLPTDLFEQLDVLEEEIEQLSEQISELDDSLTQAQTQSGVYGKRLA